MTTFDTPAPVIPRDRWNRPLIVPVDGGKPIAYTRCTTYVDCLEDKFNLQQWQLRQVAIGLAERPDLLLSVSAHRDDKRTLNQITDKAMEAARSSAASTTGTAVHALCERIDRGQPLGVVPAEALADVRAYERATACLENLYIEQFTVLDALNIGGTPDRVVKFQGDYYIADIKTGRDIEWGALKIAMQLAVYAMSTPYLPSGERQPYPFELNPLAAIVIHLPVGQATCTLHFVDIELGWSAVHTAGRVRELRGHKKWYTAIQPPPPPAGGALTYDVTDEIERQLLAAQTVDELRRVASRAVNEGTWTVKLQKKALALKTIMEAA